MRRLATVLVTSAVVVAGLSAPAAAAPKGGGSAGEYSGVRNILPPGQSGSINAAAGRAGHRRRPAGPRRRRRQERAAQLREPARDVRRAQPRRPRNARPTASSSVLQGRAADARRQGRGPHRPAQVRRRHPLGLLRRALHRGQDPRGRRLRLRLRRHQGPDVPHGPAAARRRRAGRGVPRPGPRPTWRWTRSSCGRRSTPARRPPRSSTRRPTRFGAEGKRLVAALDAYIAGINAAQQEMCPAVVDRPRLPGRVRGAAEEARALDPRRRRLRRLAGRRHLRQGRRRGVRQRPLVLPSSKQRFGTTEATRIFDDLALADDPQAPTTSSNPRPVRQRPFDPDKPGVAMPDLDGPTAPGTRRRRRLRRDPGPGAGSLARQVRHPGGRPSSRDRSARSTSAACWPT